MSRIALVGLLLQACMADPGLDRGSSGIVDGQQEPGYEAVGAVTIGAGRCTGTLVAPRVVITAKHCFLPTTLATDVSFAVGPNGEVPAGTGVHLLYPGERLGHRYQPEDFMAIVLDRPAPVAPMPYRRAPMGRDLVGRTVTLVGYGVTANGADDIGTKRSGPTTLTSVGRGDFRTRRGSGQATNCDGDSGGPVILGGEVAGTVIGSVNGNCQTSGIHTRVDRYAAVIDEAIRWADENPPAVDAAAAVDDDPEADGAPTADVSANAYDACPEGYCVAGDSLCDDELDCCAADPDCAPAPAPEPEPATCDCDTTWGCDGCWCEPESECDAADAACDCDVSWACDGCWCEPESECAP